GSDPVDLERDDGAPDGGDELGPGRGPEVDVLTGERVVHREDGGERPDREADPPDAGPAQPAEALVPAQHDHSVAVHVHGPDDAPDRRDGAGPNVGNRPGPSALLAFWVRNRADFIARFRDENGWQDAAGPYRVGTRQVT